MADTRMEPLVLSGAERRMLENWAKRRKTAQGLALRARIVLACADGHGNTAVAARLRVSRTTVSKWRGRFLARRLDGLGDEPRPGVPRTITDAQVEEVVARTLEETPVGATHWSKRELARQVGISPTSVHRIWRAFGLQPWRTEDFKISPDPLIDKIRDVIGLYLAPPANAAVFAVDEKPQIQALERTAPVLPMIPGVPERRSHDYVRHGTIDLFAALNTATGKVIGQLSAQHRAIDFRDFLDQIGQQTDPGRESTSSATTSPPTRHRSCTGGSWPTPASSSTSRPPIRPGSARWNGGSPNCSAAAWTAACSAPSTSSPPHWRTGSRSGMPPPGRSSGPRPPTRTSTASAATAHASQDRDTRHQDDHWAVKTMIKPARSVLRREVAMGATVRFSKGADVDYYLRKLEREMARQAREVAAEGPQAGKGAMAGGLRAGMGYYLGATAAGGEPDGHWVREGLADLGIHDGDVVDPDVIRKIYGEFVNPLTGEHLGAPPRVNAELRKLFAEKVAAAGPGLTRAQEYALFVEARAEVKSTGTMYYDGVFSVDKTITLAAATALAAAEARANGDAELAARWDDRAAGIWEEIRAAERVYVDYVQSHAKHVR